MVEPHIHSLFSHQVAVFLGVLCGQVSAVFPMDKIGQLLIVKLSKIDFIVDSDPFRNTLTLSLLGVLQHCMQWHLIALNHLQKCLDSCFLVIQQVCEGVPCAPWLVHHKHALRTVAIHRMPGPAVETLWD